MANQPVRIDVVSDVVCPWCFIGKHRLEKALALRPGVAVEVHWRPFFLNDWIPREGISREEYLTTKFGSPERYKGIAQRVTAAAASGSGSRPSIARMQNQSNSNRVCASAGSTTRCTSCRCRRSRAASAEK